jgi:arsenate reductase
MAEAILRRLGGEQLQACSGGLRPEPIHPLTRLVMSEYNLDLSGQESKSAQRFFGKEAFQYALLMTSVDEQGAPRLFPGAITIERWPNEDPLAGDMTEERRLEHFRAVRDRIQAQSEAWWQRITAKADVTPAGVPLMGMKMSS